MLRLPIASLIFLPALVASCAGMEITPRSLVGEWEGTYRNPVVDTGTIKAEFYMKDGELRVLYILQGWEVRADSDVRIDGRKVSFGSVEEGDEQRCLVEGTLNAMGTKITGILTIDYTLHGSQNGPLELRKKIM